MKLIIGFTIVLLLALFGCEGSGPNSINNTGIPGATDYLLVVNEFSRVFSVVDLEQGSILNSAFSLEATPNHLVKRPNSDEYWILHSETAKVYRYRFRTDVFSAPIFIDEISLLYTGENPNPYFLAFSNDGSYFYTTNWLDGTLSRYSATTGIRDARLYVGENPQGIAVLADNKIAVTTTNFLTTRQFGTGELVIVNSVVTDTLKRITVDKNPQVVKLRNDTLYVVCTGDYANNTGKLWRFNTTTFQPISNPLSFQAYIADLAITSDSLGVWGYLPAWALSENSSGTIQKINVSTWSVDSFIAVSGGPVRACSLPSGGVAVSLMESDQILIKSKNRNWVTFTIGDGPASIIAIPK